MMVGFIGSVRFHELLEVFIERKRLAFELFFRRFDVAGRSHPGRPEDVAGTTSRMRTARDQKS